MGTKTHKPNCLFYSPSVLAHCCTCSSVCLLSPGFSSQGLSPVSWWVAMQSTKQTSPLAPSPCGTMWVACVSGTLCLHPSCPRSLVPALFPRPFQPVERTWQRPTLAALRCRTALSQIRCEGLNQASPPAVILSAPHRLGASVLTSPVGPSTRTRLPR